MSEKLTLTLDQFSLVEAAAGGIEIEIDVANATLKNVPLLGPTSSNGNEYTLEAMESAVPLYKGRDIYVNHRLGKKVRDVEERFGHAAEVWVSKAEKDGKNRVRGNVPYLPSHPMTAAVLESIRLKRPYFGMSHVADGLGGKKDGKKLVEQITKVDSLDLVDKAATGSLIEQEQAADAPPDPATQYQDAVCQALAAIVRKGGTVDEMLKAIEPVLTAMMGDAAPKKKDGDGDKPPPMAEGHVKVLLDPVKALVEQQGATLAALKAELPGLIEAAVKAGRPAPKYLNPRTGHPEDSIVKPEPKTPAVPETKEERAAFFSDPR